MKKLLSLLLTLTLVTVQLPSQTQSVSGGTTSGNILPAATGQDLGDSDQRWDLFGQTLDLSGNATITGNGTIGGTLAVTGAVTLSDALTAKNLPGIHWASQYASIQAALDAASSGEIVLVTTNTDVSSAISIGAGKTLQCIRPATLTRDTTGDLITLSGNNSALLNCKVDGNAAAGILVEVSTGVTGFRVEDNTFEDTDLTDAGSNCVYVTGASDGRILRNTISGCGGDAIQVDKGAARIQVSGNLINSTGGSANNSDGILVASTSGGEGPTDIVISNNVIRAGTSSDFCVEVGSFSGNSVPSNITIEGNTCKLVANAVGGYSLSQVENVTIHNNTYDANGFDGSLGGYEFVGATNVSIIGNVCDASGLDECIIGSFSASNVTITGNTLLNCVGESGNGCVKYSQSTADTVENLNIHDNTIKLTASTAGRGVWFQCNHASAVCKGISIQGNHISGDGTASQIGVLISNDAADTIQDFVIGGNHIINVPSGIDLSSGITRLRVGQNFLQGVTTPYTGAYDTNQHIVDTMTGIAAASLPAIGNGSLLFCSDCTKATPCAGSGTGTLAKRYNGAWDCD